MVHNTSTDPNSMLHSTTKLHISQYLKHLAKLLNTSSSLNNFREANKVLSYLWTAKDGSSIHFFLNQQGPVSYFYCSTKVFNAYSDEGLTNPECHSKTLWQWSSLRENLRPQRNRWRRKDGRNAKGLKLDTLVACADFVKWNWSRVQTVLTYTQAFLA